LRQNGFVDAPCPLLKDEVVSNSNQEPSVGLELEIGSFAQDAVVVTRCPTHSYYKLTASFNMCAYPRDHSPVPIRALRLPQQRAMLAIQHRCEASERLPAPFLQFGCTSIEEKNHIILFW
jgi:hypothetical protein